MVQDGKSLRFYALFPSPIITEKEKNTMSYTPQETRGHRAIVALELARHIALMKLAEKRTYVMDFEEFNNIMVVAGMPLVVPEEIHKKRD